jgi:tetratricopeptide (TPR) repeat protein
LYFAIAIAVIGAIAISLRSRNVRLLPKGGTATEECRIKAEQIAQKYNDVLEDFASHPRAHEVFTLISEVYEKTLHLNSEQAARRIVEDFQDSAAGPYAAEQLFAAIGDSINDKQLDALENLIVSLHDSPTRYRLFGLYLLKLDDDERSERMLTFASKIIAQSKMSEMSAIGFLGLERFYRKRGDIPTVTATLERFLNSFPAEFVRLDKHQTLASIYNNTLERQDIPKYEALLNASAGDLASFASPVDELQYNVSTLKVDSGTFTDKDEMSSLFWAGFKNNDLAKLEQLVKIATGEKEYFRALLNLGTLYNAENRTADSERILLQCVSEAPPDSEYFYKAIERLKAINPGGQSEESLARKIAGLLRSQQRQSLSSDEQMALDYKIFSVYRLLDEFETSADLGEKLLADYPHGSRRSLVLRDLFYVYLQNICDTAKAVKYGRQLIDSGYQEGDFGRIVSSLMRLYLFEEECDSVLELASSLPATNSRMPSDQIYELTALAKLGKSAAKINQARRSAPDVNEQDYLRSDKPDLASIERKILNEQDSKESLFLLKSASQSPDRKRLMELYQTVFKHFPNKEIGEVAFRKYLALLDPEHAEDASREAIVSSPASSVAALAYQTLGRTYAETQPAIARRCYLKSIHIAPDAGSRNGIEDDLQRLYDRTVSFKNRTLFYSLRARTVQERQNLVQSILSENQPVIESLAYAKAFLSEFPESFRSVASIDRETTPSILYYRYCVAKLRDGTALPSEKFKGEYWQCRSSIDRYKAFINNFRGTLEAAKSIHTLARLSAENKNYRDALYYYGVLQKDYPDYDRKNVQRDIDLMGLQNILIEADFTIQELRLYRIVGFDSQAAETFQDAVDICKKILQSTSDGKTRAEILKLVSELHEMKPDNRQIIQMLEGIGN